MGSVKYWGHTCQTVIQNASKVIYSLGIKILALSLYSFVNWILMIMTSSMMSHASTDELYCKSLHSNDFVKHQSSHSNAIIMSLMSMRTYKVAHVSSKKEN